MDEFTRVEKDSPLRCQHVNTYGQCLIQQTPGSKYCINHGGPRANAERRIQAVSNYNLTKYQAELQRHANSPQLKSLTDEIGILRMSLERMLNTIEDDLEYLTYIPQISDLTQKIERTVSSCYKLEQMQGQHLDKSAVVSFAMQINQLIAKHVKDPETIEKIAEDIVTIVAEMEDGPED